MAQEGKQEEKSQVPGGSSFDDVTKALKSYGIDDATINAIKEVVSTKEGDTWRDLPFKSDINDKESIWLSVIFSTYIKRWKSKPMEEFLEFYLKIVTSRKGRRVDQFIEGLKPKIWAMQRAEEMAQEKKSRFGK